MLSKLRWIRKIFVIIMKDYYTEDHLIVNIDESTFSHRVQRLYGWALRGKRREIKASRLSESLKMISAITSDGHYFTRTSNKNTNGRVFQDYLIDLNK